MVSCAQRSERGANDSKHRSLGHPPTSVQVTDTSVHPFGRSCVNGEIQWAPRSGDCGKEPEL